MIENSNDENDNDIQRDDLLEVSGAKLQFTSFKNAPLFGRKSKDGSITLGYSKKHTLPQIVKKEHTNIIMLSKEVIVLEVVSPINIIFLVYF